MSLRIMIMDALGLAMSVAASSGLQIIAAGSGISAPAGAQLAIFCVTPKLIGDVASYSVIQEQVYVVSKGNTCRFVTRHDNGNYLFKIWTYGSIETDGSVVYLG